MKTYISILLVCLLLTGCMPSRGNGPATVPVFTDPTTEEVTQAPPEEPSTTAPEATTLLVYVPNENADGFYTTEITGDGLTVLEALIQTGTLTEDTRINEQSCDGDTMYIDFNQAFADLVCSMGTSGEYMIMGAVVNTMLANHDVAYVVITVDGHILESGHVIYDFPMEFFQ
jgi:hypothetical protein